MRKRDQGRSREIAGYPTGTGEAALRGPRADGPKGGGSQRVTPARLAEPPALRRAPPRGFKPPPPGGAQPIGSSTTTVTSPGPERQLLGGARPALRVSPGDQTPLLHLHPRSQLASRRQLRAGGELPPGLDRRTPPPISCAGRVPGARRGRAGTGRTRVPKSPPRDAALRPPPPRSPGTARPAPTHPSRAVAGRARTRASLLPRPCSYPSFRLAL